MATLICNGTGNLTGSTTFAGAETGSLALLLNRNTLGSMTAAQVLTSPTFTVTNGKVIDAVLLWVQQGGTGSVGTVKVDLQKGGVSQASVTVNKTDLPSNTLGTNFGNPTLFKLSTTATGDGGSNWTIVVTTTGATNGIFYWATQASAGFFTRALRTTTAATPAAADDLYVVGELTGAGTQTSRTVTMDSIAATAYGNGNLNSTSVAGGGIHVSNYGTLSYGTTASTNYILRVAGDVSVYQFGTLNIGASGAEIPRTSTAVLEFQPISASGDFGLYGYDNATLNIAGLSRTSGKNIAKCKLTADVTSLNVLTSGPTTINSTNTSAAAADFSGVSLLASTLADTVTNATHSAAYTSGGSVTNTTQVAQVFLARGSGTNNRFVRLSVGNATTYPHTNGFFADVDLQAGTIGTCTALGNGTATSSAITACGTGFVCTIIGKASSGAQTPNVLINICSAAGTTSFAGAANQSLIYEGVQLVTAASISTTFNVDTDTGWLSGDVICVAATSRTGTDCENSNLSANAGASSFSSALYPFGYGGPTVNVAGTHSGTAPTAGEIGMLTRNVKIRSTSTTLWSFIYLAPLATVTFSWAEFYYLGANISTKYGIYPNSGASANAKSITFCSMHDMFCACYAGAAGSTSLNLTFSSNVVWNTSASSVVVAAAITNTDWTADSNVVMKSLGHGFSLADVGGTCTNNTVVGSGAGSYGFDLTESSPTNWSALGTFSGNVVHSSGIGIGILTNVLVGTLANCSFWRNGSLGVQYNNIAGSTQITWTNLTLFGNPTNISAVGGDGLNIIGGAISGDASFATSTGISISPVSPANLFQLNLSGIDFSGTGTGLAPHTSADILPVASQATNVFGVANNCKWGAGAVAGIGASNKSFWAPTAFVGFEKYGQTAGDHRCEMRYGQLKTDSTIFNTATPSMRMTPNNASNKLESAPKYQGFIVPVASGVTKTISVYIRKSAVGDGTAYTGNQPRLIQRANGALGQTADVVLATYSASTGAWNQLSAACSSPTDDGAFEFIVDCDGTVGWVNVDDWAVA